MKVKEVVFLCLCEREVVFSFLFFPSLSLVLEWEIGLFKLGEVGKKNNNNEVERRFDVDRN